EIAAAQTGFSQGRTLMIISNLEVFEVEVEVDETEINKIELSQHVEIEVDAFPDTSFGGKVVEIGNTAISSEYGSQGQSTNFRVKVTFTDPRVKLRPGMSATVDITSAHRENVLTIPYSAVVMRSFNLDSLEQARAGTAAESGTTGVKDVSAAEISDSLSDSLKEESDNNSDDIEREELKGVFVIRDDKAMFIEIETGIADQKNIEVILGLNEEDSVIAGPYRVLRTVKEGDNIAVRNKSDKKNKGES
ncbi:MAG: efflux RND transporter periplasmic adaptor subunit, partial [candidate division Zixibacteria bacterium]|nr:efflux RND transporter periplasmic adaptor subunit [candidate division Zixibacteria bacterium]